MQLSSPISSQPQSQLQCAEIIRIRGTVQGVGFRPTVWTIASELQLTGSVSNDGDGVLIEVHGSENTLDQFVSTLQKQCPPLATIESIQRDRLDQQLNKHTDAPENFNIKASTLSQAHTHIPPDSATCESCLEDINDPNNRRFGYPFTNCTHCGPRLSIIKGIPYDRPQTSMSAFKLCDECQKEYDDPSNRRFHAQPNACPDCGPKMWLEDLSGGKLYSNEEALTQAVKQLKDGKIVAIKGVGGIHLAVDANNEEAIHNLRKRKHRPHKPLALMAKNLAQIEIYCRVNPLDAQTLLSASAPIVLLTRKSFSCRLSCNLAPHQMQLGFMLPYSPLHHLLMQQLDHPIVLTSGNLSNEPQCTDNEDARERLSNVADVMLLHDRNIENRMDDSVIRYMAGDHRLLRRARGYAPTPIKLHSDFASSPDLLAMGGELKNTFCVFKDQQAVLSQHMGDLESYSTYKDYQRNLKLYKDLYQHNPKAIVIDKHPEYLSSKLGKSWGEKLGIPVIEVQHHHAHIAACLAENKQSLFSKPVLGIALDGLGFGNDGTLWGGEFLLADYRKYKRLACFKPTPLIGGSQAMREPWRNTYSQLHNLKNDKKRNGKSLWESLQQEYSDVEIVEFLNKKPLKALDQMIAKGINSPLSSSCGRLFDAVAAAIGICTEQITYEGQAAIEMEALLESSSKGSRLDQAEPYIFNIMKTNIPQANDEKDDLKKIDATPMWQALLEDLSKGKPSYVMSARFHLGLANVLIKLSKDLIEKHAITQVVLTGGVFQNKTLLEALLKGLQDDVEVLTHHLVPANDGGLALGQAAIAAAQHIIEAKQTESNRS